MSKIGVLGTGSWATALSRVLIDNQNEVIMYGIDQNQIDDINNNHQNKTFFKEEGALNENKKESNEKQKVVDVKDKI